MEKELKIGDIIIITKRKSDLWGSSAGGKCPNNVLEIPFTGEILNIDMYGDKKDKVCINIEGWGFVTENIEWEFVKQKEISYEIY